MYKILKNHTHFETVDCFNTDYAQKAIEICSLLNKFQIEVSYYKTSNYKEHICLDSYDALGCYIRNEIGSASSTYAEIAINEDALNLLNPTKQEFYAALAHEIGHIMLFFSKNREQLEGLQVEIYCDQKACQMGLAQPLKSLLEKLIQNEHLPQMLRQQINYRIKIIE